MGLGHALFAPSGAHQAVHCAGSVGLQKQFPQESTDESRAGDAAHWVCSSTLANTNFTPAHFLGSRDPAGTMITDEMVEAANMYVNDIRALVTPQDLPFMRVEQAINCARIHPTDCWGTPDFAVMKGNTLYIKDFKFGYGFVEEYENWQNITYAAGLLDHYGIDGFKDQHVFVDMAIIQPRYYHASPVRSWRVRASDLRGYFNKLAEAADKAVRGSTEYVSGPHCRHCTGRRACPAARQAAFNAIDVSTQAMAFDVTPASLGTELDMLNRGIKAMEYMRDALMEHADSLISDNIVVPGYAKQPSKGHARWKLDCKELIAIGQACGHELQEQKAISPFQAKQLGIDETFIERQTERPVSMKLKRVNENQVKKVFGNVK